MGKVDQMDVDEMGVDKMGSRGNGMIPILKSIWLAIDFNATITLG